MRRRAAVIAVDMVEPGQTTPATTLLLQQEGSQWLLVALPDEASFRAPTIIEGSGTV